MNTIKAKIFITTMVFAIAMLVAVVYPIGVKNASAAMSTWSKNLAGLIAVDNVFDGGTSGSFGSEDDLGELLVLSGLFPYSTTQAQSLAGLIAVDNVFDGGSIGKDSTDSLAELIVLGSLFDP